MAANIITPMIIATKPYRWVFELESIEKFSTNNYPLIDSVTATMGLPSGKAFEYF